MIQLINRIGSLAYIWGHPLNRHRAIFAARKLLIWQARSRSSRKPLRYRWVNNATMLVRPGDRGFTGSIYCGLHEYQEMSFVGHVLRECDLFVDVGANVGAFTVLAGSVCGAKVVSVEPVASTYKRMRLNVVLNDLSDVVEHHRVGLGSSEGVLSMTCDEDTTNHIVADGVDQGSVQQVRVTTLDSLMKGRIPTIVKVDVEGFEGEVLRGGVTTFGHPNVLAVILEINGRGNSYGDDCGSILRAMECMGFDPHCYHPSSRVLLPLASPGSMRGNVIFVKRASIGCVSDRLRMAAPLRVHGRCI